MISLAAPLVMPFARMAGIIKGTMAAGAGLAAIDLIKDQVDIFMQENPEQSMKILDLIMPGNMGLSALFNEEISDDGEEEEITEEVVEGRSKKEIVLDGLRRAREGKGNYSDPNATGPAVSARGNIIRGLEDAGEIEKGPNPNYDPDTKYQGYKRFINKKYATGGRVGFKSGKLVKDGIAALLRSVRSKFGKDSIKTVENEPEFFDNMEVSPYFNIKRPEAAIRRDQFKNFGKPGKFNEDGTIDYDYYAEILNDAENDFVTGGESIGELEIMLKERLDEHAYMYDQYITGKLDPKPGESGRESFLQQKLDEVESSGDRRLITLEELDELDELKGGPGRPPGFTERQVRVPKNIPMEMMTARIIKAKYPQAPDELAEMIADLPNDKKALALADLDRVMLLEESGRSPNEIVEIMKREPETKMADGGPVTKDVSLTAIKIPDINESGVESLFKRR